MMISFSFQLGCSNMLVLLVVHLMMIGSSFAADSRFPPGFIVRERPLTINMVKTGGSDVLIPLSVTGKFGFTAVRPGENCLEIDPTVNSVQYSGDGCTATLSWSNALLYVNNIPIATMKDAVISFDSTPSAKYKKVTGEDDDQNLPQLCQPKFKPVKGTRFTNGTFTVKRVSQKAKCGEILLKFASGVSIYKEKAPEPEKDESGSQVAVVMVVVAVLVLIALIVAACYLLKRRAKKTPKKDDKPKKGDKTKEEKTEKAKSGLGIMSIDVKTGQREMIDEEQKEKLMMEKSKADDHRSKHKSGVKAKPPKSVYQLLLLLFVKSVAISYLGWMTSGRRPVSLNDAELPTASGSQSYIADSLVDKRGNIVKRPHKNIHANYEKNEKEKKKIKDKAQKLRELKQKMKKENENKTQQTHSDPSEAIVFSISAYFKYLWEF